MQSVVSAVQDLTVDPDGLSTVITFPVDFPAGVTTANFEASGGQTATGVTVVGAAATVVWDARVSPSDTLRTVGIPGFSSSFTAVTASDVSVPSFTVSGSQVAGLGNDVLTVTFSGPRVVESEAEDVSNWVLRVNNTSLTLTGATLDLIPATQVLTITLPSTANLHASFDLATTGLMSVADVALAATPVVGAATGDAIAPGLTSATQNLAEDEFGKVIDFVFAEAMDPTFATVTTNFDAGFPVFATNVTYVNQVTLRVTFTAPVIPGVDSVTLTDVVDVHGNAYAGGAAAIVAGSTVANAFSSNPTVSTVSGAGGDLVVANFVQAIDPADAEDPAHWTLLIDGNPIVLADQTLSYDFTGKQLTIFLADDFDNGDSFSLSGASGNEPIDVDGQIFTTSFAGTVAGEVTLPTVLSVVQNRAVDPSGATLDVTFSEDIDNVQAELVGNWTVDALTVSSATLQSDMETVRLVLSAAAVPGDVDLDVSLIEDLAGNVVAPVTAHAIVSTDTAAPLPSNQIASAVEGAGNDTLAVAFSDSMVQAEVEDISNWTVQSPVGSALTLTNSTVSYDTVTKRAVLTFVATDDINLKTGDDFNVSFTGMRDLGGNTVSATVLSGNVAAESTLPRLSVAHLDGTFANQVHVRYSEPCDEIDDLFDASTNPTGLTEYVLRNSVGTLRANASSVSVDSDLMGCVVTFGVTIQAGDTIDVIGITDLAGNPMFPSLATAIGTEESGTPTLGGASEFTTISGEENDTITVVFDRDMSAWELLDLSHYALELASVPVPLTGSRLSFNGTDTVTIFLENANASDLATASNYDLMVSGLQSAQGASISGTSTLSISSAAGSDAAAASLPAGSVVVDNADMTGNSIIIQLNEAIDATDGADESLITLNGGNPSLATVIGPRSVRATFGSVTVGQTLNVTFADRAGNSALASLALGAADTAGPLLTAFSGTANAGLGRDVLELVFDEPVDPVTALTPSNYTITHGGTPLSISGSSMRLVSGTNTVRIELPGSVDLDNTLNLHVLVDNVEDTSGNAISPQGDSFGSVGGDVTAPGFSSAFVNFRAASAGTTVDILFDEDVDPSFATNISNFTSDGGQTLLSATLLRSDTLRLVFDAAISMGDQIDCTGLLDPAQNASGAISVVPTL